MKPDCSCCSEERFNTCQTQGRTSCLDDCKPGYHGGYCYNKCPDHCLTCKDWELPNTRICLTCEDGYRLAYRRCVANTCPETCLDCSNITHCTKCVPGYYNGYDSTSRKIYSDCHLACSLHCISCNSKESCSTCESGYYGTDCSKICSDGCHRDFCDISGNCLCKSGYTGSKCETCMECQDCPVKCINNACNKLSGACLYGCIGNFQEPNCKDCLPYFTGDNCESCILGMYGTNCSMRCPEKCQMCDKQTGHCNVCEGNLKGNMCESCISGKYDINCTLDCAEKCKICHRQTGHCEVCGGNFVGSICNDCKDGFYGENCSRVCSSNCVNKTCIRSNGTCSNGCISLYSGDKCCLNNSNCKVCASNSECSDCDDGWYGVKCHKRCTSSDCRICDKEIGSCRICNGNYMGENCEECKIGFYGLTCDEPCSEGCMNKTCDISNGTCTCNISAYGSLCNKQCSSYCFTNASSYICDKVNGDCSFGCLPGYFGSSCEEKCNENCINKSCGQYNGTCTHGCIGDNRGSTCGSQSAKDGHQSVFPVAISVGSSIGGIAVVLIIVMVVIVLVRSRKHKNSNDEDNPLHFVDDHASTSTPMKQSDTPRNAKASGSSYVNLANEKGQKSRTCIKQVDISDFVLEKDVTFFQREFSDLPSGFLKSYAVSQLPENTGRNRYRGVYPYDEYRVKLQGRHYGDYINASYIDGYGKKKAYIACLGPMKKHTEDFIIFWLMAWQQKVEMIVMVTNLIEELDKVKCEKYWPDVGSSETFGDIVVICHSEDKYTDFTIRSFTVSGGKENRRLYQIHFTAWPDRSVPHDVTSLIEFRNRVNSKSFRLTLGGPIIVHCSAGVGRTGTYIALDILTQQGQAEGEVDIFRCVMNLRGQRINMVQTWEQYRYLHFAVLHSLTFDPEAISSEHFQYHLQQMTDQILVEKFRVFKAMPADLSEDELDAIQRNQQQIARNRTNVDIEGDSYRPRLYLGMKDTDNDYINAVYLNSYKQVNRFIITQTPMTETVIHFLTLLVQENCPCIVSLDDPRQKDKSVGLYLPADNQQLSEGQFIISCRRLETAENFILRRLAITTRNIPMVKEHSILHFQITNWRHKRLVPETPESFVTLVRAVEQRVGATQDTSPIVVHCMDAAERSGLFCAVSVLIEKEEVNHEVSVVNTLTHVRSRRSKAIPNKEQFQFCYQCVNAFLRSFDTYSNFV